MECLWCVKYSGQSNTMSSGRRTHSGFISVTGLKRSYGKIPSPHTEIPWNEPSRTLIWTHGETQSYSFRAYRSFGNSYSCMTAVKWYACDVENTAGKARRCRIHSNNSSRFHPGRRTGLKCSARLPRSRIEKPRSREPSQLTLSYEHNENFAKDSD